MKIEYHVNKPITVDEFILVLQNSGLAERRPVHDRECIAGMLEHANLLVTARIDGKLVGVARSLTDFHYACYLSDLAVDKAYQAQGIGIALQRLTQAQLGPHGKLILLAAPQAVGYYPKIGYTSHPSCWIIGKDQKIG